MEKFIEIQNWGFNALTWLFLTTTSFSALKIYGLAQQGRRIWIEKSAQSLSPPFFFLFLFSLMSQIFYGINQHSLALVLSGLVSLIIIPIVIGIIKYQKLSMTDWLSLLLSTAIVPIMILIANKNAFLSLLLIIGLTTLICQLMAIVKEKSRGLIEIKLIIILLAEALFWVFYSHIIKNIILEVFHICLTIIYIIIIYLYKRYK